MRRFEFSEGSSNKFWEIALEGASFHVRWGKIGTDGQSQTKKFASGEKAQAEHDKLVAEKMKKGYREVGAAEAEPASSSPVTRASLELAIAKAAERMSFDTDGAESVAIIVVSNTAEALVERNVEIVPGGKILCYEAQSLKQWGGSNLDPKNGHPWAVCAPGESDVVAELGWWNGDEEQFLTQVCPSETDAAYDALAWLADKDAWTSVARFTIPTGTPDFPEKMPAKVGRAISECKKGGKVTLTPSKKKPATKKKATDLRKNFAKSARIPEVLLKLADYQKDHGTLGGVDFNFIADGKDALDGWCHGNKAEKKAFAAFGSTGEGSLYAFWFHESTDLEDAPIVLLDSDVDGSRVLASSVANFARLVAAGWDPFPPNESDDLADFREWVKTELGLAVPRDWKKLAADEKAKHADLAAWLEENHDNG